MPRSTRPTGFTLIETMMAAAVIAVIGTGLIMVLTALQRNFAATNDYATNHADEIRISDYLALDLRRALSVQISGTGSTTNVTLTIPNYYDSGGNPRMPVVNANGTVSYADTSVSPPATTVTVKYYLSGGAMIRSEGGVEQQLAVQVKDFELKVLDSATDPNATQDFGVAVSLAGKVAQVKTQISFNPNFRFGGASSAGTKGTTFYNTTLLRNARDDQSGTGIY